MGRPSKLTPETQSKLIQAIRAGSHLVVACRLVGVDYSSFRRWLIKGEKQSKGRFREFCEAVRVSEAEVEIRLVASWQQAAINDWRAASEFLSRRYPDRWSPSTRVRVEVERQVEAELNVIYDAIENDPNIPIEYKKAVFTVLSSSGESAPNQN